MESVSDSDSVPSPEQASVLLSPNSEQRVEAWQHTGGFPFPELNVYPQPPVQELSRNELRLIQHLSSISSDLHANGNASLTIWAQKLPRYASTLFSRSLLSLTRQLSYQTTEHRIIIPLRDARIAVILSEPHGMGERLQRDAEHTHSPRRLGAAWSARSH